MPAESRLGPDQSARVAFCGPKFCFRRGFPLALAVAILRHLAILELRGLVQHNDAAVDLDGQPTLADLPGVRTAMLELTVKSGLLPLLPSPGGRPVTELRSLTLTVGSSAETPVLDMPALTKLQMDGVGEHRHSDAMSWLAALPALQVSVSLILCLE